MFDAVVVGAGIVGLATARELLRRQPGWRVAVLEKEGAIAEHQTGRNSNVIHSGIYYQPDSVKAKLCVKGVPMLYALCDELRVPYNQCGKLIVATKESELSELDVLYRRGQQNGVRGLEMVPAKRIREIEPHCSGGLAALWSPYTGIVDYAEVSRALGKNIVSRGGVILLNHAVEAFEPFSDRALNIGGGRISLLTRCLCCVSQGRASHEDQDRAQQAVHRGTICRRMRWPLLRSHCRGLRGRCIPPDRRHPRYTALQNVSI